MKKIMILLLAILVCVSFVNAGYIDFGYYNRTYPEIGADKLDGHTYDDIEHEFDVHESVINSNSQAIVMNWVGNQVQDTTIDYMNEYIDSNEDSWKKDNVGGGMSKTSLSWYLLGNGELFDDFKSFFDYLKEIFAFRSEIEKINDRIDRLEAIMILHFRSHKGEDTDWDDFDQTVALIKAGRTEECSSVGKFSCSHDGVCVEAKR